MAVGREERKYTCAGGAAVCGISAHMSASCSSTSRSGVTVPVPAAVHVERFHQACTETHRDTERHTETHRDTVKLTGRDGYLWGRW